jgi:hypothetical protein
MQNREPNAVTVLSATIDFTLEEVNRLLALVDIAVGAKKLEIVYEAGYFFKKLTEPFQVQPIENQEIVEKKEG